MVPTVTRPFLDHDAVLKIAIYGISTMAKGSPLYDLSGHIRFQNPNHTDQIRFENNGFKTCGSPVQGPVCLLLLLALNGASAVPSNWQLKR